MDADGSRADGVAFDDSRPTLCVLAVVEMAVAAMVVRRRSHFDLAAGRLGR
jgi:hypothetical protein